MSNRTFPEDRFSRPHIDARSAREHSRASIELCEIVVPGATFREAVEQIAQWVQSPLSVSSPLGAWANTRDPHSYWPSRPAGAAVRGCGSDVEDACTVGRPRSCTDERSLYILL